jgi:uncharacterized protein YceK
MKYLIVFLFLIGCSPVLIKDSKLEHWKTKWVGIANQEDGSAWDIQLTFLPDKIMIEYPSLHCGGIVDPLNMSPDTLIYIETIYHGKDNCMSGCKIVITKITPDSATYLGYYPDGNLGAEGYLIRRE